MSETITIIGHVRSMRKNKAGGKDVIIQCPLPKKHTFVKVLFNEGQARVIDEMQYLKRMALIQIRGVVETYQSRRTGETRSFIRVKYYQTL